MSSTYFINNEDWKLLQIELLTSFDKQNEKNKGKDAFCTNIT